jgi:FkbM family methyltransferase
MSGSVRTGIGGMVRRAGHLLLRISTGLCRNGGSGKQDVDAKSEVVARGRERNLYRTPENDLFWLAESGYIDRCIIRDGVFEEKATAAVKRLVGRGDFVFDVGANIGYYSVLLSRLVGRDGKVFSFEPTERYADVLEMNLEANRTDNVAMFRMGLSNRMRRAEIQIGESSATLHPPGGKPLQSRELIELTTLDRFVDRHAPRKIDFIKVDIDGHEPLFFEGACETLDRYDPVILLEVNHLNYLEAGTTAWEFYDSLKKNGYRIYHESDLVEIATLEDFLVKCGNFAYSANIVVARKDLHRGK